MRSLRCLQPNVHRGGPLCGVNHGLDRRYTSAQASRKPPTQLLASLELNHRRPTSTPYTKPAKMATRTRNAKVSLLDDRIDILNRGAVDVSSAKQVFRTVSATLALVRVSTTILHPSVYSPW